MFIKHDWTTSIARTNRRFRDQIGQRMLFQVTAPHFVAGIIVDETSMIVTRAAPILRWSEGKPIALIELYCHNKRWSITSVDEID